MFRNGFIGPSEPNVTGIPGMLADLAVLWHDIFTIPVAELRAVRSVLTIVGGKVVYEAAAVQ
jgi:hypothetical protein